MQADDSFNHEQNARLGGLLRIFERAGELA